MRSGMRVFKHEEGSILGDIFYDFYSHAFDDDEFFCDAHLVAEILSDLIFEGKLVRNHDGTVSRA